MFSGANVRPVFDEERCSLAKAGAAPDVNKRAVHCVPLFALDVCGQPCTGMFVCVCVESILSALTYVRVCGWVGGRVHVCVCVYGVRFFLYVCV